MPRPTPDTHPASRPQPRPDTHPASWTGPRPNPGHPPCELDEANPGHPPTGGAGGKRCHPPTEGGPTPDGAGHPPCEPAATGTGHPPCELDEANPGHPPREPAAAETEPRTPTHRRRWRQTVPPTDRGGPNPGRGRTPTLRAGRNRDRTPTLRAGRGQPRTPTRGAGGKRCHPPTEGSPTPNGTGHPSLNQHQAPLAKPLGWASVVGPESGCPVCRELLTGWWVAPNAWRKSQMRVRSALGAAGFRRQRGEGGMQA